MTHFILYIRTDVLISLAAELSSCDNHISIDALRLVGGDRHSVDREHVGSDGCSNRHLSCVLICVIFFPLLEMSQNLSWVLLSVN